MLSQRSPLHPRRDIRNLKVGDHDDNDDDDDDSDHDDVDDVEDDDELVPSPPSGQVSAIS